MKLYIIKFIILSYAIFITVSCDREDIAVDIVNAELTRSYVGYSYTWTTTYDPTTGQRYPNDTIFNVIMPDYNFRVNSHGSYGLVQGEGDPNRARLSASLEQFQKDTITLSMPNRPISKFTFYRNERKIIYSRTSTNGRSFSGFVSVYFGQ